MKLVKDLRAKLWLENVILYLDKIQVKKQKLKTWTNIVRLNLLDWNQSNYFNYNLFWLETMQPLILIVA